MQNTDIAQDQQGPCLSQALNQWLNFIQSVISGVICHLWHLLTNNFFHLLIKVDKHENFQFNSFLPRSTTYFLVTPGPSDVCIWFGDWLKIYGIIKQDHFAIRVLIKWM